MAYHLQPLAHPAMTPSASARTLRAPMLWGIVVGLLQAATPLAFWWLDSATVCAGARSDRLHLRRLRRRRRTAEGHRGRKHRDLRLRRGGRRRGYGISVASRGRHDGARAQGPLAGATSSPTRDGGRRSAWSSTGSSPRSSSARPRQACSSADADDPSRRRRSRPRCLQGVGADPLVPSGRWIRT